MSRGYMTSLNMGDLVPVYMEEIIPGDTFRIGSDVMVRFASLIAPIMDRVDVRLDFFFVPARLCFDICCCDDGKTHLSFENFITGGPDGKATAPVPSISFEPELNPTKDNDLLDYLGFKMFNRSTFLDPVTIPNITPVLAYQLICDNFYMDQTFDESLTDKLKSYPVFDSDTGLWNLVDADLAFSKRLFGIRHRLFAKDYFTTAMPAPQRGDSIYLMNPLQTSQITGSISDLSVESNGYFKFSRSFDGSVPSTGQPKFIIGPTDEDRYILNDSESFALRYRSGLKVSGTGSFESDEFELDVPTINDFFTLQSIQRWLNHNNNFGGRYVEQLVGHFGVVPSDARLNLPQYLGGGKCPVMISEVLQTAESSSSPSTGVGDYAGHAIAFGKTSNVSRSFNEHGILMGIISIIPKNSYTSAIPKLFFKNDKFDFAFPEFANIGEQEIKNKEIFFDAANPSQNEAVFGYTPRYAEYRQGFSLATGDFRDGLSFWHLGRVFSELPTLSLQFLQVTSSNTSRIFQDNDDDSVHIYVNVWHNVSAIRPLPLLPNTSLL